MTWNDAINSDKTITNGLSTKKAYSFNPPTIKNSYCVIGSYSVVNVVNTKLKPSTEGIKMSETCSSSDCLDLDLVTTNLNQTIYF